MTRSKRGNTELISPKFCMHALPWPEYLSPCLHLLLPLPGSLHYNNIKLPLPWHFFSPIISLLMLYSLTLRISHPSRFGWDINSSRIYFLNSYTQVTFSPYGPQTYIFVLNIRIISLDKIHSTDIIRSKVIHMRVF